MSFDLPPDNLDRELVLRFFWKFSVFECALKRERFLRRGRSNAAEADWECFARELQVRASNQLPTHVVNAIAHLRTLAPRRQIVRKNRIEWESVERRVGETSLAFALRQLRTVRNNLFHGGKYPDGPIEEVARNRDVLEAAIAILHCCYEMHERLRRCIDQAA